MKPLQRFINWFIDFTVLIFETFFGCEGPPCAKYQKIWVRMCFGSTYDVIKTLKLQYLWMGYAIKMVDTYLERK